MSNQTPQNVLRALRRIGAFCLLFAVVMYGMVACGGGPTKPAGPDHVIDPGQPGPYAVGVTTIRLKDDARKDKDGNPRPMIIEIWYPAETPTADTKSDIYDITKDAPPATVNSIKEVADIPNLPQNAYRDANPLKASGPYPLILFSHGSGGIRFQSVFLCPHLASHGYVVASVDHEDNTLYNILAGSDARDTAILGQSALDRPKDLVFLRNTLIAKNKDAKDNMHNMIQPDNVGVTGHSFGGFTSILALKAIKEIKVSIPQAPFTSLYKDFGVTARYIGPTPIMLMASQQDLTLPYASEAEQFYKDITTGDFFQSERYFMTLKRGGHSTFSNLCDFDAHKFYKRFGFSSIDAMLADGCHETDNIKTNDAHDLINKYTTAMFNVILRKSEGTREYLKTVDDTEVKLVHNPKP